MLEDGVVSERYDRDLNGNRVYVLTTQGEVKGSALVYDDQDRPLQYGSHHYTYDGMGMLSSRTQISPYSQLVCRGIPWVVANPVSWKKVFPRRRCFLKDCVA